MTAHHRRASGTSAMPPSPMPAPIGSPGAAAKRACGKHRSLPRNDPGAPRTCQRRAAETDSAITIASSRGFRSAPDSWCAAGCSVPRAGHSSAARPFRPPPGAPWSCRLPKLIACVGQACWQAVTTSPSAIGSGRHVRRDPRRR